ncbi:MAG: bifunctional enoyl-CoA hydratase/phosphate acetyltransferase [Christensenellales bacterium]
MKKNINNFSHLIEAVIHGPKQTIAVVSADDISTLEVIAEAEQMDLANFILIGDENKIKKFITENNLKISAKIVDKAEHRVAAETGVSLVRENKADVLMKGMLHSSVFLKAVLNKEKGLNTGKHVTQISVLEKENGGLLMITDCAISIEPDLNAKVQIIQNAVELAHKLGVKVPKVAVLAPIEVVNPAIQDTVDAAVLSKMAERGQIKGCIIDGPLAFDNAISQSAAQTKGIESQVAGNADIILVPNLAVGNALTKSITYIAKKTVIAATVGAAAPLVFTSRTESKQGKLLTIALAAYGASDE